MDFYCDECTFFLSYIQSRCWNDSSRASVIDIYSDGFCYIIENL